MENVVYYKHVWDNIAVQKEPQAPRKCIATNSNLWSREGWMTCTTKSQSTSGAEDAEREKRSTAEDWELLFSTDFT